MYSTLPSFILGFHGCDKEVADRVISRQDRLVASENDYDWLGHGIYFWENNPRRALQYARLIMEHPKRVRRPVAKPFVVGAVIDLGHCLNLLEGDSISIVKQAYDSLVEIHRTADVPLPENRMQEEGVPILRYLDCAVMEVLHRYREDRGEPGFDSIRAMFTEGGEIYPASGFREKNHIQVCVRNPNCIKGYFHPLDSIKAYPIP